MWGVALIGQPPSKKALIKSLAALAIAYINTDANLVISGEIPVHSMGMESRKNMRIDHVAYSVNIPLNLQFIILGKMPTLFIEDSVSLKRLKDRMHELVNVGVPTKFIHVKDTFDINTIIQLNPADEMLYELVMYANIW